MRRHGIRAIKPNSSITSILQHVRKPDAISLLASRDLQSNAAPLGHRISQPDRDRAKSRTRSIFSGEDQAVLPLDQQTLKVTRFVGTLREHRGIQIAVALIVFLLLRVAQAAQKAVQSPTIFARLIRANLMHRRPNRTAVAQGRA
jgi:hypothetical protein